jgi:hypothetical protein
MNRCNPEMHDRYIAGLLNENEEFCFLRISTRAPRAART